MCPEMACQNVSPTRNSVAWVREQTIPTEQPPLVVKLVPTFVDSVFHVVSVTSPYVRILYFLDRMFSSLRNFYAFVTH
jgi:hypothetical protein